MKSLRVERGLTLGQIAEQTQGSYEADDLRDIGCNAFIQAAKFCGVTADYLPGLPETLKADYESGKDYMKWTKGVYDIDGSASVLPHPGTSYTMNTTLSDGSTESELVIIEDRLLESWNKEYKNAYIAYLHKKEWSALSDEGKKKALQGAHTSAMSAAKKRYGKNK